MRQQRGDVGEHIDWIGRGAVNLGQRGDYLG
jgi:hypothetical protein